MAPFLSKRHIEDRLAALDIALEDFVNDLNDAKKKAFRVGFDGAVVYDVLISSYRDIQRYKDMHQQDPRVQKSDSIKRAAYFTKWLIRLRPIWVEWRSRYKPSKDDTPLLLNEKFALEWALSNLEFELGREFPIPNETTMFNLLYFLHYRAYNEDALMEIFQILFDSVSGAGVFVNSEIDLE